MAHALATRTLSRLGMKRSAPECAGVDGKGDGKAKEEEGEGRAERGRAEEVASGGEEESIHAPLVGEDDSAGPTRGERRGVATEGWIALSVG